MLYSKPCEHAIRAMAYLALQPQARLVRAVEVADAEGIGLPFLARILHQLARAGLLSSRKGPGGGFQLAKSPRHITLRDIVEQMDGLESFDECAAGLARCSDQMPCPLHHIWKDLRGRISGYLEKTSLAEMAQAVDRKRAATSARSA